MAHPLGGFFDVPHGVANSILLPVTMKFNMLADHGKYKVIAHLLGEDVSRMTDLEAAPYAVEAVKKLSKDVGIPENLVAYGVTEDKIPQMSKDAMLSGNIKVNPRVTKVADIENMYRLVLK
jgi:alcohol dehydrogenase